MDGKIPMQDPTGTTAWRRLKELAKHPITLRGGTLSPERIRDMRASAAGLTLLYATQRVDDRQRSKAERDAITGGALPDDATVMDALVALAEQTDAVAQLRLMVGGAFMNCTKGGGNERRRVLHTASRDVFPDLAEPRDLTPPDAKAFAKDRLVELERFLGETRGEFTDLVQVGIGGSDLGPRAICIALREFWKEGRRVHFISNVDPDDAAVVLDGLDLSHTLVAVITKSGTTLETLTNQALVASQFARTLGLSEEGVYRKHFVAVTASPDKLTHPYRHVFLMGDYIGGRYSATSMVGGVPLGFGLGIEGFRAILRGAREMDLNALEPDPSRNLPLLAALLGIWNRNFLNLPTVAILPYSQMLSRFVAHLQQLDMESNGKRVNRRGKPITYATGPIVWGEPGTNGQHAFYQLIHQSETVIPCEFIGFRHSQTGFDALHEGTTSQQKLLANLFAQVEALATGQESDNANKQFPGNRPSSILIADKLTPRTLGALLAYYEHKVAFQGFIWNINSFDQEGVQLGKKLAEKYIADFKGCGYRPDDDDDGTGWAFLDAAGLL